MEIPTDWASLPRCGQGRRGPAGADRKSELRGADLRKLLEFGRTLPTAKFALLADYANSRGAADMGLLPDMLPGYTPLGSAAACLSTEYGSTAATGLDMLEMFDAAAKVEICSARCTCRSESGATAYNVDPASLKNTLSGRAGDVHDRDGACSPTWSCLPRISMKSPGRSRTHYGDLQLGQEGRRSCRRSLRLRDDRAHRGPMGAATGSRSRSVPSVLRKRACAPTWANPAVRTVRRGGSACGVADGK